MKQVQQQIQRQVQQAIDDLVESGAERGMQVAVYHGGELVVDAVAGIADPSTGRTVRSDTPFHNFSIGKGAASTVAHVLAERGLFGYDTPVVDLWPDAIGRPGALSAPQESASVFGIGGVSGSFAYGDTSTGVAFALTKNRLTQDFSAVAQLSQLVTDALADS